MSARTDLDRNDLFVVSLISTPSAKDPQFKLGGHIMANEVNNEDKVEKAQEMMDDKNYELNIDELEDAAGGNYRYFDTYAD